MSKTSLRLFLSYSHKDSAIHRELDAHLSSLRHQGLIVDWYDRQISPGSAWERAISSNLDKSDIIILLISADFVNSSYCFGLEMQRALSRHDTGVARVIPVIARPCRWEQLPFARLQALPHEGKPITTWTDRDSAYLSVVEGVEIAARELLANSTTLVNEWLTSLLLRRKVVRFVQTFLRERRLYRGAVDGEPANLKLREAVRRFQDAAGIEADGLIGPQTLRAIMSEMTGNDTDA